MLQRPADAVEKRSRPRAFYALTTLTYAIVSTVTIGFRDRVLVPYRRTGQFADAAIVELPCTVGTGHAPDDTVSVGTQTVWKMSKAMSPDDEHYIGYMFTDVARLLRTVFERRVRSLGLTRAQWVVIARLHRRSGLSQSEVADLLEIEKATAGRLIDRMEVKGWLERRSDPNDRRINRLHLTAEAERLHALIWPLAEDMVDEALSELSVSERRALNVLMRRVKGKLLELAELDPVTSDRSKNRTELNRVPQSANLG